MDNVAKQKDEDYREEGVGRGPESGVKLATEMMCVFPQRSPVRLLKVTS